MNFTGKVCAVMQPTFLPWIGYFDLIDTVDVFVFYDDVQHQKQSWIIRNRIKTANGVLWLTLPVNQATSHRETLVNTAQIDEKKDWRRKILESIRHAYSKSTFFDEIYCPLENSFQAKNSNVADFNIEIIKNFAKGMGITTEFRRSSELDSRNGQKDFRLVDICKELGCETYLSPAGAVEYIDENRLGGQFPLNNIQLFYHNYSHPTYRQRFGDFISHLSIIDLLFNVGWVDGLSILKSGRLPSIYYKDFSSQRAELLKEKS